MNRASSRPGPSLYVLAGALLVVGLAVAWRMQRTVTAEVLRGRLARDLAPDEAASVARALAELEPGGPDAALESLAPAAKLRFLLATGFDTSAAARRAFPRADGAAADPPGAAAGAEERRVALLLEHERRLRALVADLVRDHPDVATRFAAEATDPGLRLGAVDALALGAGPAALRTIRERLRDPAAAVARAALVAGQMVARRAGDEEARIAFLAEAVRVKGLWRQAIDDATFDKHPRGIPVLIAFLEVAEAAEVERTLAAERIREIAGPERAATAPRGLDPAAWRAWWESAKD